MSGLKERDLVFVRFQGEGMHPKCLPYFIAIDHETHNVGVSSYVTCLEVVLMPVRSPGLSSFARPALIHVSN